MGAQVYTEEEARRLKLRPLPDVPFIGHAEIRQLRKAWEQHRKAYREINPLTKNIEPGDPGYASTRESKDPGGDRGLKGP